MVTAIASLQAEIGAELARLKEALPAPTGQRISTTLAKQFQFPDGRLSAEPFEAILLDWRWVNTLYSSAYHPEQRVPPDCWAIAPSPERLVAAVDCAQPQHASCRDCPKNQFGSAGRGKACKNGIRLALIPPEPTPETVPWTLTISPTGIKPFLAYTHPLLQVWGKLPIQMITRIGFNPKAAYPTLLFQCLAEHEQLELAFHLKAAAQPTLDREFD